MSHTPDGAMMVGHVAIAMIEIAAPPAEVWRSLVDPASVREYMFGSEVVTDWSIGSPILFRGVWEGKRFEDKGAIVEVVAPALLRYTHFSTLSGAPDVPENYHTLTYALDAIPEGTRVTLSQDNNATEEAAEHAAGMWRELLKTLRAIVER